jgi:hypothetical protein
VRFRFDLLSNSLSDHIILCSLESTAFIKPLHLTFSAPAFIHSLASIDELNTSPLVY